MFDFGLISGPIIGGIFGCANAWLANKKKEADNKHEIEVIRENRETRKTEAECEIATTKEKYAGEAFTISQRVGNRTALSSGNLGLLLNGNMFMKGCGSLIAVLLGLTDVARHAIRPSLTLWLGIVTHNMISNFMRDLGGITIEKRMEIVNYGVMSYIQLFMVCVSWWFGDRMTNKLLDKGK